jgi:hypothetical protein
MSTYKAMTNEEKESEVANLFEYLDACEMDKLLSKGEAWDILVWYRDFLEGFSGYVHLLEYHAPQVDPDIGFRFVFDDDRKFLEIEYSEGEFNYYFRDRKTEWDKEGPLVHLGLIKRFLRQLKKTSQKALENV